VKARLDVDHPWPGPDSFRPEDEAFFRGRDKEVEQLLQLTARARAVVLYGASGLGKTSLINAGLVPRLAPAGYFAAQVRISYGPKAVSVAAQIQGAIVKGHGQGPGIPAPSEELTAWEFLHLRHEPIAGAQPLLIFDQFEELFTIGAGTSQASDLVEELRGLIEGVPPGRVRERLEQDPTRARALSFERNQHRVLISIREDFLYGLEALRSQIPSLIHNRYRIGPLSGLRAMEVVLQSPAAETAAAEQSGQAELARVPLIEADVAQLVVRTVAATVIDERPLDTLEVEPALLSILCAELARRRSPGTSISRDLVTGSRADIISSFYERALEGTPAPVRAYIEDELVTATGFRTSAVLVEALAVPGFSEALLTSLIDKRLLRAIERTNGKWLELTHDILTEVAGASRRLRMRHNAELAEQKERLGKRRRRLKRILAVVLCLLAATVWRANSFLRERQRKIDQLELESKHGAELLRATEDAKRVLRRQFIEASLREGRNREALLQLAAVVREEPEAISARALVADLLLRRNWPLPIAPLFPDGPFTSLDCNAAATRCAVAYRDGRVLVRGDLSRDLATQQTGYAAVGMSDDGAHVLFVPEQAGDGLRWTLDATATSTPLAFRVEASWSDWGANDTAEFVALPVNQRLDLHHLPSRTTRSIPLHIGGASVALSRDGRWLAYQYDERTVRVEATGGGGRSTTRELDVGLRRLEFAPDSKQLFAALNDGSSRRWLIPQGKELQPLQAGRPVTFYKFELGGKHVAVALEGGGVKLWSAPFDAPRTLLTSSGGVMSLSFSQQGDSLSVATRDGTVTLWNTSTGESLVEPIGHGGLAFSRSGAGRTLVSVSLAGSNARWVIPERHECITYDLREPLHDAWFLDDGRLYARGQSSGLEQKVDGEGSRHPMDRGRSYSRDRRFTTGWFTQGLWLRDERASRSSSDASGTRLLEGQVDFVEFSGNGERLFISSGYQGHLFDTATQAKLGTSMERVTAGWLSHDGSMLATKSADPGVTLWSLAGDGTPARFAHIDMLVASQVAFDRAKERLVVASENQARLWNIRARAFVGRALVHEGPIRDVAFSHDGRWVVTASEDTKARVWEAASGLPASDWFEHTASVLAADFSPSGRRLLTASSTGQIHVWSLLGNVDASDQERLWLARLAETLSGLRVDLATNEVIPALAGDEALSALAREVDGTCGGGASGDSRCSSETSALVRRVLAALPHEAKSH
jgi:WD40 repeat protein